MENKPSIKLIGVAVVIAVLSTWGITLQFKGVDMSEAGIGAGIKNIIEEVMKERLENIDKAIALNTEFRVDEYIKLIIKNAKKIKSDPSDVKASDIELCLSYLPKIPAERKTEYLQAQIDVIVEYAQQNP